MKLTIETISYHRNGIAGEGFHVVTFLLDRRGDPQRKMMATLFEDSGQCAVLDRELAGKGRTEFMVNSWRGDHFEHLLRQATRRWGDGFDYKTARHPDAAGWVYA